MQLSVPLVHEVSEVRVQQDIACHAARGFCEKVEVERARHETATPIGTEEKASADLICRLSGSILDRAYCTTASPLNLDEISGETNLKADMGGVFDKYWLQVCLW